MTQGIFLAILFISAIFGGIAAMIANARGASEGMAFLAGALLGPLGIVVAFVMERKASDPALGAASAAAGDKVCPRCAEAVKAAALVCRFCGHEFALREEPPETAPPVAPEPPARVEANGDDNHTIAWVAVPSIMILILLLIVAISFSGTGPVPGSGAERAAIEGNADMAADNLDAVADNMDEMDPAASGMSMTSDRAAYQRADLERLDESDGEGEPETDTVATGEAAPIATAPGDAVVNWQTLPMYREPPVEIANIGAVVERD